MKTDRALTAPLLARLSVELPSEKPPEKDQPRQRDTKYTRVSHETTDDD